MNGKTTNSRSLTANLKLWRRALGLIWTAVPGLTVLWGGLLVAQGLLPGVTVYLTKLTIDNFIIAHNRADSFSHFNETFLYFILTGLCILLAEILQYVGDWTRTAQGEYFSDHLKNLIHAKSAEVDLEFYESPAYHDLMEQARGESQSKPLALLESLGSIVQNLITLVSFGALLFAYGWAIPVLLVAGSLPGLFIALRFDRLYHKWWRSTANDRRWLMYFDSMMSHSSAAAEMRLFDLSRRFRERFQTTRQKLRTEKLGHLKRQFIGKVLANGLALATAAVAVGWIALRVFYKTATLGDLAVFFQVFSRGQTILRGLLGGVGQTMNNSLYLESLFAYLDLESKVVSPAAPIPYPVKIESGIRFNRVTFCYPGAERPAISNFDLFIPAGKIVAVVGVNGAGKTTLIKLLSRFYDPTEGSIEIDGIDIREFDLKELRRNISVLFQFPMQFHETAADNVSLGDTVEEPTPAKIRTAAERAGADGFISKLPDQYDTLLGKWFIKGCELSGGEWQRIALARAYFRQSPLIVLDEPTSFMDSWSEADWFDRFRSLMEDRTGLIITHRFTIAMRADVIYVLDGGRLIESGTHRELVEAKGFYADSWENQMLAAENVDAIEPSLAVNDLIVARNTGSAVGNN